ncbi:hypothetical protein G6F37_003314 [Rhizopus arrhizus]|nr:hypothetical protein G6F38_003500 [Rhizopus arrhizus]KAG1161179.1 hypothetical protein G6F37_003314 [Rhizopus arrhizus]
MDNLPFIFQRTSDKCFFAYDLDLRTTKEDLWDLFEQYGRVKQIQLRKTNNKVAAAIIFSAASLVNDLKTGNLLIRGELVNLTEYSLSDYVEWKCQPLLGDTFSMGGLSTPTTFVEEWSSSKNIRLDVNILEKYIEIFFFHLNAQYRLRIKYNTVLKDAVLQRSNNMSTLIVAAKYPAYFWKLVSHQEPRDYYDFSCWERVNEIPFNASVKKHTTKNPVTPEKLSADSVSLNSWSVYKVELDINDKAHEDLEQRIQQATKGARQTQFIQITKEDKRRTNHVNWLPKFTFEVQYMLQHAFNLKILREYNIDDDFYQAISNLDPYIACKLLSLISAEQRRLYDPNMSINNAFKQNPSITNPPEPIPEGYTYLRKVLITPTSVYPLQPVLQRMNHLQYQFQRYSDRFLLVQFTDEELGPIIPSPHPNQNDKLYNRIFKVLKRGLMLSGRYYEFLCSSLDDLRDHSCWFFAPTDELNRDDIIYWLGDFQEISCVPKYIQSVGQVMSPRLTSLEIKPKEVEEIDDYEHNGFIFSSECGKMSPQIAREISSLLGLRYTPNVVKFNLAGARGILMLSNYLQKRKVQLRTGQIHFNTERLTLEINKISKRERAYLDKYSITLLTGLGIHPAIFQQITEGILQEYLMGGPQKENLLNHLMDEYYSGHFAKCFNRVVCSGFLERGDPLITNLVLAFQNKFLGEIKENAKMYIQDGARAFAVMDETGSLGENEVFFQTSTSAGLDSELNVIIGKCLIFRNSSCNPNDVMIVKAVDSPKLRSYTNVLIYSAVSSRHLLNICSHDDANENNFTIVWDHRLIPNKTNCGPTAPIDNEPPKLNRPIKFSDVSKFIVKYISEDQTNLIKDAWVASADRHSTSIYHGNTLYFAQQLSIMIAYAKTGISVPISEELYEYPIPDFMEQDSPMSYQSKKPLGYIHRLVKTIEKRHYVSNRCEYDTRLYVEGMHKFILDARKTKIRYDNSLRLLMGEYGICSEIEFISGCIVHFPKYTSESDKKELTQKIRRAYIQFKNEWKKYFEFEFYKEDVKHLSEDELNYYVEAKAAAWYYVTYHPAENKEYQKNTEVLSRCLSFPWVIDDYIVYIASKNSDRPNIAAYKEPVPESLIISHASKDTAYIIEESDSEDEDEDDNEDSLLSLEEGTAAIQLNE